MWKCILSASHTLRKSSSTKVLKIQEGVILLYHFFHPDDVISARLFSDIAEELAKDGGSVVAMPSVRSCHDGEAAYSKNEVWKGVEIRRVWRPDWRQGSNKGRIGNAIAMLVGWSWRAVWTRRVKNETVVIGTDPPLSVLVAIPWRLFRPRARIIHWCHDLYPQAAVAEGIFKADSILVRGLNALLRVAYARCDVIADLGLCMRKELLAASGERRGENGESPSPPTPLPGVPGRGEKSMYSETLAVSGRGEKRPARGLGEKYVTLTPWALVEPERVLEADVGVRRELFGEAKLGLLYSGNLGRAHVYEPFIELARRVASDSIAFCFAGRGAGMERLEARVREVQRGAFGVEKAVDEFPKLGGVEEADETSADRGQARPNSSFEAGSSGSEGSNSPSQPNPLPSILGRGEAGLTSDTGSTRVTNSQAEPSFAGNGEEDATREAHFAGELGRGEVGLTKELGDGTERTEGGEATERGDGTERAETVRGGERAARADGLEGGAGAERVAVGLENGGDLPADVARVRFAGFASEEELGKRLGAADVHMVSLAPSWTGTVVPSKFFGALAVGRPVLFAGSRESAIARWIDEFKVGWVLDDEASIERVAGELRAFAAEPDRVKAMRQHCFEVYHREFSKAVQLGKWKGLVGN